MIKLLYTDNIRSQLYDDIDVHEYPYAICFNSFVSGASSGVIASTLHIMAPRSIFHRNVGKITKNREELSDTDPIIKYLKRGVYKNKAFQPRVMDNEVIYSIPIPLDSTNMAKSIFNDIPKHMLGKYEIQLTDHTDYNVIIPSRNSYRYMFVEDIIDGLYKLKQEGRCEITFLNDNKVSVRDQVHMVFFKDREGFDSIANLDSVTGFVKMRYYDSKLSYLKEFLAICNSNISEVVLLDKVEHNYKFAMMLFLKDEYRNIYLNLISNYAMSNNIDIIVEKSSKKSPVTIYTSDLRVFYILKLNPNAVVFSSLTMDENLCT